MEGMEIYSTTLWHLQKDVALSALSKDLTDMDRLCPQVLTLKTFHSLGGMQSAPRLGTKALSHGTFVSPQAWCVAGNCFSLQQEHDIAIKFFQRAIQVPPERLTFTLFLSCPVGSCPVL